MTACREHWQKADAKLARNGRLIGLTQWRSVFEKASLYECLPNGTSMTIRINSTTGLSMGSSTSGVKKGADGFSLSKTSDGAKAATTAQTSAALGMMGVDALLALQGEEDVLTGRRRRQIKRSHEILDALDDLKVSVLGGDIDDEALLRLQTMISQHREDIQDDRLQGVLNEIETRACVELAKRRLM